MQEEPCHLVMLTASRNNNDIGITAIIGAHVSDLLQACSAMGLSSWA